jgi:hypothetical protein
VPYEATTARAGDSCLWCRCAAAALGLALVAAPVAAQQKSANGVVNSPSAPPAIALAVRAQPQSPTIDGDLNELAWQDAPPINRFTQRDPNEGEPATERTEARVLYSDAAVYVAVRAWDSRPQQISARLTRRDVESPSDWIGIAIDSYYDRRTAFLFMVNPAGVKRDIYMFDDNNEDSSWDAVWDVATRRDSLGWTAEFRIPFSQLRFSKADRNRFGFNIYRKIDRLNEEQYWRVPPKDQSGVVSRFGDLDCIEGISPPRRLEIMPYTVFSGAFEQAQVGNPFQDGRNGRAAFGADVNYGLTSNLTLSATVNPDFGQVEADPAVVNLSAFESFFPEKRPFFNEGLDIFRFGLGDGDDNSETLFYTRRIGRAPQGNADTRGGFAETIQNTTIYGAAKVTGKTQSGWTLGLLGASTAEERAQVIGADGLGYEDVVEPRSDYMVGSVSRDFRDGLTKVGLFGTAVRRSLPENMQWLRSSAFALGTSWSHRFAGDNYNFSGRISGSLVNGSEQAIELTQRSSARYFQRPDNDHVTFDPTRTSLSGFAAAMSAGRHAGSFRYFVGIESRSPGFEVNDVGFQQNADYHLQWAWLNKRWLQPGKVFRRFNVNFNQWSVHTYGWDRTDLGGNVNLNFTLRNYWRGFLGVNREAAGISTRLLRGGPSINTSGGWNSWIGFSSDSRKALRGGANAFGWKQDDGGTWMYGLSTNFSWRAAANMDFTMAPRLNRALRTTQYLRTTDVLGFNDYLFGELKQTTVAMTFRGNVTFSPNLSLQLYAEPFVSSGDYQAFRRVADPRG